MKKWFFITFLIITCIGLIFFYLKSKETNSTINFPSKNTPSPATKYSVKLDMQGTPLRISWTQVHPKDVEIYSNLQEKQTSQQIKSYKNCRALINGGFYSKTNTHLGLLISNYQMQSQSIQSSLFNGFLSIESANTTISNLEPSLNVRTAVQSGPLLILNNQPLPLSIRDDQPNRRIVAATTKKNELIFIAVYGDKSELQGPLLEQLPNVIDLLKHKTNLDIVDAINLDGGSASAFITESESLLELAQIGSYFCAK